MNIQIDIFGIRNFLFLELFVLFVFIAQNLAEIGVHGSIDLLRSEPLGGKMEVTPNLKELFIIINISNMKVK